ncbi:MAG TPA: hypothetical protein VNN13_09965, partial [Methylomirabilota bacterium]|nr:hypothetical protein [Methylomirabilota bacterium]
TGVAYAEVDPADRRNNVIVDLALAQTQPAPGQPGKTPGGKVAYLFNFYILKPENLSQVDKNLNGYGKVMYEPPNRGNKTWTALGRVTGGGNYSRSVRRNSQWQSHIHRPQDESLPLQLRAGILRHRHPDHFPARDYAAVDAASD